MLNLVIKGHREYLKAETADEQKLFVMLKLLPNRDLAQSRGPLALAMVVDTSGSMQDQVPVDSTPAAGWQPLEPAAHREARSKLELAIEATCKLIEDARLQPQDQLAIVQFDSRSTAVRPLGPLTDRAAARERAESLREFSGGTMMPLGMNTALEQLRGVPGTMAKRVFLFTDGETNGEADCATLAGQFAEANVPIVTIGVGTSYNEVLLRDIAGVTRGVPYHLKGMAEFEAILKQEVGTLAREVATDVSATVALVKGVLLESVTRVYPSLAEIPSGARCALGNIPSGDYSVFLLELALSGVARPASRARIAQITVSGFLPAQGQPFTLPVNDVFVSFVSDPTLLANVDAEVLGYAQQRNVDKLVQDAVRLSTVDAEKARKTLQLAVGMTQRLGNAAVTKMLENALGELNATGTISAETRKTVALGGRTKTIKTGGPNDAQGTPSDEEIRKLLGH